jgi:hypothetical protein
VFAFDIALMARQIDTELAICLVSRADAMYLDAQDAAGGR